MRKYELTGCTLEADAPVEVGRGGGHFWFSSLHAFGTGAMLCEVVLAADRQQGEWPAALYLSRDGGASWARALEIDTYGPASTPVGADKVLLMPYELWPIREGDRRNARAPGTLVTLGGDGTLSAERPEVKYLGLPRDLEPYGTDELCLLTNGNILPLKDGALFTTVYGKFAGDEKYCNLAFRSEDGGYAWAFLSVVADAATLPDAPEGPDESNNARLADGRLMSVYRIGSGRAQLYHASYSSDEGRTWTPPRALETAWSVEPQLVRLQNDLLLLSGGRPGLSLWVSTDGEGRAWQSVSLAAHHNAEAAGASMHYTEGFCTCDEPDGPAQSTSYTGMRAVGPEEVLVSYDRLANGWGDAPGPWGQESAVFTVRVKATR